MDDSAKSSVPLEAQKGASSNVIVMQDVIDSQEEPDLSDAALGLMYAEEYQNEFRYVDQWGQWMWWDGKYWRPDHIKLHNRKAEKLQQKVATAIATRKLTALNSRIPETDPIEVRNAKRVINKNRAAKASEVYKSARIQNNMLFMAKPNRRMAATVDQWDNNDNILNTEDGIIDLQTGHMMQNDLGQYITMRTNTSASDMPTPLWNKFLRECTGEDKDLELYMQRVFGYCLTGLTNEQTIFFGYGTGSNGKSILINTVSEILGDYHKTASMDTFIASPVSRHPAELAYLRGARLVTAVETEAGRRWNESRIKTLTGGEKITARFMRENFFEFLPRFKIFVIGNHKPSFHVVDESIRRRFQLVPFTVTIPREKRDKFLFDKLKAEWPGILQWLVRGTQMWQADGLAPPSAVEKATEEYLYQEDLLTAWYKECCTYNLNAWTQTKDLYGSWATWCAEREERSQSMDWFGKQLKHRYIDTLRLSPRRRNAGNGYDGIALKEGNNESTSS